METMTKVAVGLGIFATAAGALGAYEHHEAKKAQAAAAGQPAPVSKGPVVVQVSAGAAAIPVQVTIGQSLTVSAPAGGAITGATSNTGPFPGATNADGTSNIKNGVYSATPSSGGASILAFTWNDAANVSHATTVAAVAS